MTGNETKVLEVAEKYLFSLRSHGPKYGIDRMRNLVQVLGSPQSDFPVIHVAGTNGKGSVCAMLEAVLRRAGSRVGMLTSPHLIRLGERIQVDRVETSDEDIVGFVEELKPVAEQLAAQDSENQPSFFELITAMGFLFFARSKVDVAVVETGLGGRLDATNVVQPILSVITSVGLDHVAQLGSDLTAIATEKAGIVKPQVPVVVGRMPTEAREVIKQIAEERGSEIFEVESFFPDAPRDLPETNLQGTFQRWNAATTVVSAKALGGRFGLDELHVPETLLEVEWAGRWQCLEVDGRTLILDATHNEEGARYLEENLAKLIGERANKPWVVVGILGEERASAIMPTVAKWARGISLLRPNQPRACSFEALERELPTGYSGEIRRNRMEELFPDAGILTLGEPGDVVLVTGSIYLVGEVLAKISGKDSSRGLNALQDWI